MGQNARHDDGGAGRKIPQYLVVATRRTTKSSTLCRVFSKSICFRGLQIESCRMAVDDLPRPERAGLDSTRGSAQTP